MSVKVGVRVRPFNQRETDLNCKLCVEMMGGMTRLFNADEPDKHRDFTFDYSFWSHDEFNVREDGYFEAAGHKYADQKQVFDSVGKEILSNAWEGYHCCLFAYGQTGSGKSYSMVGYGANKGIVPISCEQIFKKIALNDDKNKEYQVHVSMMEIYNEKVQDLLIPIVKRPKEGYKIREHKTLGIYVEGMSKHFVDTYESIEKKMEEGSRNRSIAATEMNASSSRAHTIISIEFKQIEMLEGKKREKLSVIYLVDLAGSEKVGKTNATGDRLKEAAGINKSLSVLGLVISTLADKATGKNKNAIVPYRDSCLTRILQNALGGNSKTLMICAISPATDNYEETLSTLRYADQAKKIMNKAVVNESETDKLIRTLKEDNDTLKQRLQKMEEMLRKFSLGEGHHVSEELLENFNDTKEQLRFNQNMMNDYSMTRKEKLIHEQEHSDEKHSSIDKSRPHLSNISQDMQLSRLINYSIDTDLTTIGKRHVVPPNDIELVGMGIRETHAHILKEDGHYMIEAITQDEDANCYLNGDLVETKVELHHLDRLSFGTNYMFLVLIPGTDSRDQVDEKKIDWQFAQNELYLKKELIEKDMINEVEKRLKEENEAAIKVKEEELAKLMQNLKESEESRKNLEQQVSKVEQEKKIEQERKEAERLKSEINNGKKKMLDSETLMKQKIKEKYQFEKKLLKTLPKCIEINLIAKEFKRNVSMSVKMTLPTDDDTDMKTRNILIKVVNRDVGYAYYWDVEKLSNRYYIIKDMSQNYFETGQIPELSEADDPFWDPPEHTLIGRGYLTTKSLAYMFDCPVELPIIGDDEQCGQLQINLVPTDETGTRNLCQEMEEEEVQFQPQDLLNKPFHFLIIIKSGKVPNNFEHVYVEYSLKESDYKTKVFCTQEITEKVTTPNFNYTKLHSYQLIDEGLMNYLTTSKLVFRVYGWEMVDIEKKQEPKTLNSQKEISKGKSNSGESKNAKNESQKQITAPIKSSNDQDNPLQKTKNGVKDSFKTSVSSVTKASTPASAQAQTAKTNRTPGAAVNNKINERDKTKAKDKDCLIY